MRKKTCFKNKPLPTATQPHWLKNSVWGLVTVSLPRPTVAVESAFLVGLATAFADKNPDLPLLNLHPKHGGMFCFAGSANFGFHDNGLGAKRKDMLLVLCPPPRRVIGLKPGILPRRKKMVVNSFYRLLLRHKI